MEKRLISGIVLLLVGFLSLLVSLFFGWTAFSVVFVYAIILIILAIIILFNRNEDKIEGIKLPASKNKQTNLLKRGKENGKR